MTYVNESSDHPSPTRANYNAHDYETVLSKSTSAESSINELDEDKSLTLLSGSFSIDINNDEIDVKQDLVSTSSSLVKLSSNETIGNESNADEHSETFEIKSLQGSKLSSVAQPLKAFTNIRHTNTTNNKFYFSLMESIQKLQSAVRNTRGMLNNRYNSKLGISFSSGHKPHLNRNLKRKNSQNDPINNSNTNARNKFSGHSGGVSILLEVVEELIDSISLCIEEQTFDHTDDDPLRVISSKAKNNMEHETDLAHNNLKLFLQHVPVLSVLYGHLRDNVILNKEYYYSFQQDFVDVDFVLTLFVSLFEYIIELLSSLKDCNNEIFSTNLTSSSEAFSTDSLSENPAIEVVIFQILITVIGEGVNFIKQINDCSVNISLSSTKYSDLKSKNSNNSLENTNGNHHSINEHSPPIDTNLEKKRIASSQSVNQLEKIYNHYDLQHRQRLKEGAIFRTNLSSDNSKNLSTTTTIDTNSTLSESVIDLWKRLEEWTNEVDTFFSVNNCIPSSYSALCENDNQNDISSTSSVHVWKADINALICLSKRVTEMKTSNEGPFESTTSVLASIACSRKKIIMSTEIDKDRQEGNDTKRLQKNFIPNPERKQILWNDADMEQGEPLFDEYQKKSNFFFFSDIEITVLGSIFSVAILTDIVQLFRWKAISLYGLFSIVLSLLIKLITARIYGPTQNSRLDLLSKSAFTPFDLMLDGKKNVNISTITNILPRDEIINNAITFLLHQAQQHKNSRKHKSDYAKVTILTGLPGCGSTTMTAMIIQNTKIKKQFYHGIAWLSLGPFSLTYGGLIELYDQIFKQLLHDPSNLFFDIKQFYVLPESDDDERDLMLNLLQEMKSWFCEYNKKWKARSLIVLDNVRNLDDLKWFQFDGIKLKSNDSTKDHYSYGPSLLVSYNSVQPVDSISRNPFLKDVQIFEISSFNDKEALTLFSKEIFGSNESDTVKSMKSLLLDKTSSMSEVIFEQCQLLPHPIKLLAAMIKTKFYLSKNANIIDADWWEVIYSELNYQLKSTENLIGDTVGENRTVSIINLMFSSCCIESKELAAILKLFFISLVIVFFDSSCFLNDHPNYSPNALFIPWTAISLFWNALLDSKDVTNEQIISLERIFLTHQQSLSRDSVVESRAAFIRSLLESFGLIKSIFYKSEDGKTLLRGIYIPSESIKFAAEHILMHDSMKEETFEDGFERKEREWNLLLVNAYQKKLERYNLEFETLSTVDIDHIGKDELRFLLQYLPHHLITAGMSEIAGKLLAACGFVRNRLIYMGIIDGTKQHIKDAESLLEVTHNDFICENDIFDDAQKMDFVTAKSSVIIAYEQVADYLFDHFNSMDENDQISTKAGFLFFILGCSIKRQGWRNEAFMIFHDAVTFCRNELLADESSSNVRHVLSRALLAIGLVLLENKDTLEAIKTFTEAIDYNKSANVKWWKTRHAADTFHNLGQAFFVKGDYDHALDSYTKASNIHSDINSAPTVEKANILFSLGKIHQLLGRLDEAYKNLSESLNMKKSLIGNDDVDTAKTLEALGNVCEERGETKNAIQKYSQAIIVWKNAYQSDSIFGLDYAHSLHNLGVLYRKHGALDKAMEAYQSALHIRKMYLGSFHVDVAQTYHNIGIVYCENGKYDDAMRAYARALRVREELLGTSSADFTNTLHNIGMVLRQKGDTDVARKAFMEALWIAKALDIEPPTCNVLRERCEVMFGSHILNFPCVSSRVFACASLMVDTMLEKENQSNHFIKARSGQPSNAFMEWVRPVFPLLTSFVDAEVAILSCSNNLKVNEQKKSIRFCSYDFSSVFTPVDIVMGSNKHIEVCIYALEKILQEIDHLCLDEPEIYNQNQKEGDLKLQEGDNVVTKMLLVFHAMAAPIDGLALRNVCAEAMSNDDSMEWQSSRFVRAAEFYKEEFEAVVALLESRKEDTPESKMSIVTELRQKLALYLSSAIRFHLRRLFDPPPISYTIPSQNYPSPDYSACRAKTHELLWMASSDDTESLMSNEEESKLSESSISYVLNLALRHIYEYFEALPDIIHVMKTEKKKCDDDNVIGVPYKNMNLNELKDYFQLSSSSLHCLNDERRDLPIINDIDAKNILDDIYIADISLSASRAARFVLSLMKWPGVNGAIEKAGGWTNCIESFANILSRHHLDRDCPEDAHLILLKDVRVLVKRLENEKERMMEFGCLGQRVLHLMWKRFQRGSRNNWDNTNENFILQSLVDGSLYLFFPSFVNPDVEMDDTEPS